MMRVLLGDKGSVDLDGPVRMSAGQRAEFVELMRTLFDPTIVKEQQAAMIRPKRLGDKLFQREWDAEEIKLLFEAQDTQALAQRLGRSWMSVDIKRGEFLPGFFAWAESVGRELVLGNTKELIEEYLKERTAKRASRRQEAKEQRKQEAALRARIRRIKSLLVSYSLLKSTGVAPEDHGERQLLARTELELLEASLQSLMEKRGKEALRE